MLIDPFLNLDKTFSLVLQPRKTNTYSGIWCETLVDQQSAVNQVQQINSNNGFARGGLSSYWGRGRGSYNGTRSSTSTSLAVEDKIKALLSLVLKMEDIIIQFRLVSFSMHILLVIKTKGPSTFYCVLQLTVLLSTWCC